MKREDQFETEIPELAGRTVARAVQTSGDYHPLDGGYEADGDVVMDFTDGSRLTVQSHWCNDDTASTEYGFEETPASEG